MKIIVWVYDPVLLDQNEGGYEWWDQCLVPVEIEVVPEDSQA